MPDNLRDWAIVVLAFFAIIQNFILIIVLLVALRVMLLLKNKMAPILDSARETVATVKGTSTFVSDTVVKPIIRVASFATGVRTTMGIITRLSRRKGGK